MVYIYIGVFFTCPVDWCLFVYEGFLSLFIIWQEITMIVYSQYYWITFLSMVVCFVCVRYRQDVVERGQIHIKEICTT